jgi:hypothetical protein
VSAQLGNDKRSKQAKTELAFAHLIDERPLLAQSGRPVGRRVAQERSRVRASQVDCLGKQVKHNGGRHSAGLLAGPAPTSTGVTIPDSANSPHPALVNAHSSGDDDPVPSPLDNVII